MDVFRDQTGKPRIQCVQAQNLGQPVQNAWQLTGLFGKLVLDQLENQIDLLAPRVVRALVNQKVFSEGTILLKELQLTLAAEEDGARFSESQNWGYFNFGTMRRPMPKQPPQHRLRPVRPAISQTLTKTWSSRTSTKF